MLDTQRLYYYSRHLLQQPLRVARVNRQSCDLGHVLAVAGSPKGLLHALAQARDLPRCGAKRGEPLIPSPSRGERAT